MAIKILKEGQTKFTGFCSYCGCEFIYELEDITASDLITCPCCGKLILHVKKTDVYPHNVSIIPCNVSLVAEKIEPSDCEECDFFKAYLAGGKTYAGDSPCQGCSKYPYKITCKAN